MAGNGLSPHATPRYMSVALQIADLYEASKIAPVTMSQIDNLETVLVAIRTQEFESTEEYPTSDTNGGELTNFRIPVYGLDYGLGSAM
jgi:hypothetical protein